VTAIPLALEPACMPLDAADNDRELIERARSDREALAALYRRHQPRIAAYVVRRVGNTHEAEDLVANVFLAMVRGLAGYRASEAPFVAWLYRIATNEINRSIRKRRIRRFFGLSVEVADQSRPDGDHEPLRRALAELPLHFQTVLSLHYLEELSIDEVAAVTGSPPGTIKSRLSRGRELLRSKLKSTQ
jgi:RNA polymerase sigma-70 factor (ECF subfamily)